MGSKHALIAPRKKHIRHIEFIVRLTNKILVFHKMYIKIASNRLELATYYFEKTFFWKRPQQQQLVSSSCERN